MEKYSSPREVPFRSARSKIGEITLDQVQAGREIGQEVATDVHVRPHPAFRSNFNHVVEHLRPHPASRSNFNHVVEHLRPHPASRSNFNHVGEHAH